MENNEGGQARKHHYVPQCYLKGFARNRSKKSQLYVVDSAVKRDFDRIEVDGEDPNLIELSYAEFESKLAPALVRMDAKGDFPDDADRALILELVALLAVRNPGRREAMRQFKEETTLTVSININGLTLCHRGSGGRSDNTLPDVCKTPGNGTPVPYQNEAHSSDLVKGSTSVFTDGGNMIAIDGNQFSKSIYDEAGSMGGVVSGTHLAETDWITHSFDVFVDKKPACRLSDKLFVNHRSTANMVGLKQRDLPKKDQDFFDDLCEMACEYLNELKHGGVPACTAPRTARSATRAPPAGRRPASRAPDRDQPALRRSGALRGIPRRSRCDARSWFASTVLSCSGRGLREIRNPPVEPVQPVPYINAVAAVRVEQWQPPHPPPLPQFVLQGLGHVRYPDGVRLSCVLAHRHGSLQNLTVAPGGMQAQREPQTPSFPFRLQKPVSPESVSAPAVLRHHRPSVSSGQIQNMLHLVAFDAGRQCQQLVVLRRAGLRVKSNQIEKRLPSFAILLVILDESHGHGSPLGKMMPVYRPAGRLLFITTLPRRGSHDRVRRVGWHAATQPVQQPPKRNPRRNRS
ncbi:PAAR-like domain-containing protein [Paraburkholderia sediminicola]|uniref:PAAR-like domain-containing protein n=1 Tax=Paraburkholderia sediminicola TaxID=458836 RepID=UPI0038B714F2